MDNERINENQQGNLLVKEINQINEKLKNQKQFVCVYEQCKKIFKTKRNLENHYRSHVKKIKRNFTLF
jgi:hypothetical protein